MLRGWRDAGASLGDIGMGGERLRGLSSLSVCPRAKGVSGLAGSCDEDASGCGGRRAVMSSLRLFDLISIALFTLTLTARRDCGVEDKQRA